jgi:hypothetical protein
MAYTNVWDDSVPTGGEAANTIATLIRSVKVDVEQRFEDIFGTMPNFTADPLRPYGLKFTDAANAVINLGDNAGTPRNLIIKNKAGSTTYITFGSSPAITIASGGLTVSSGTSALQAITGTTLTLTSTLSFGAAPATSGQIRLENNTTVTSRNAANSANINLIKLNGTNQTVIHDGVVVIDGTSFNFGAFTVGVTGLTVSAGTSALQAVTATTVQTTGNFRVNTPTDAYYEFYNVNFKIGVNNATGLMSFISNTTTALTITSGGGVNIPTGTLAAQAITCTSINASSTISISSGGLNVTGGDIFINSSGFLRVGAMGSVNASALNMLFSNGAAPTGNPTGGVYIWAEGGALKARGTGGTVTTIAPA